MNKLEKMKGDILVQDDNSSVLAKTIYAINDLVEAVQELQEWTWPTPKQQSERDIVALATDFYLKNKDKIPTEPRYTIAELRDKYVEAPDRIFHVSLFLDWLESNQ